ncbi:MAG TPA: substrate binding domain-containing protein, partial [Roseomonas sp.]
YARSSQILLDLEDADRMVGAQHATPRGTLKLYANTALVRFLVPVIDEFVTLFPAVSLNLTAGERMIDLVEDGFDLAIRPIPLPDSSLVVRLLTSWRHILCCSPSYLETYPAPARLADLAHHNCLQYAFYPYGEEWRFEGTNGQHESVRVSGNLLTNSAEAMRTLCLNGRGIWLAPSFVVAEDIASGRLVRLLPQHRPPEFPINAIYPHRHHLSTKVRSFIDLLAQRFAAHRQWMHPTPEVPPPEPAASA